MYSNLNPSWTIEEDKILINFVKKHEALYNMNCKEYRKTQMKQKLWCEIGNILNKTDFHCSKRWCYVRDYYVKRKAKPGPLICGEVAKKRSDLLTFLDSVPSSKRKNVVDENSEDGSGTVEDSHAYSEENNSGDDNTDEDSDVNEDDNNKREINVKRRKKGSYSFVQESLKEPKMTNIELVTSIPNELDETDLFFSSMSKIVKKLPRFDQAQLRMQIASLVGNAEMNYFSKDSCQNSESPKPSDYSKIVKSEL